MSAGSGRNKTASEKSVGKYKRSQGGVDESLFGGSKEEVRRQSSGGEIRRKPPVSKVEMDSTVLTNYDLDRIRRAAAPVGHDAQTEEMRQQREAAMAKARERKQRMLAMEEQRKARQQKTDLEIEDEERGMAIKSNAEHVQEETLDAVKHMNSQMLYAKCVTIRDAQLLEKQMVRKELEEEDKAVYRKMEEERLKAIAVQEARERELHEARLRGARILQMQIKEREEERMRQQELLDMEREAMISAMERIKAMEAEKEQQRKEAGQTMLREAALANEAQMTRKAAERSAEADQDRKILEYIEDRDRREQARIDEMEAERRRKAEETARIRAMQEKQADRAAELDALRAKRAAEDYERSWRAKERAEAQRKQEMLEEIQRSRDEMKEQKQRVLLQAAQMEKEQFERILGVQKLAELKQREVENEQRAQKLAHKAKLQEQIAAQNESRQRQRQEFLDEGAKVRYEVERERKRIEAIKQNKVSELRQAGVPEKYLAELSKGRGGLRDDPGRYDL
eukprot:CAMPEP_0113680258 /NCGR_PEP_ID=MMETSP0038_2-20120614/11196_1 /TAXON_ID=2898 /ORGANISM="Cryptomonas paramecium" /LENGTH=510 /DNA_ID=CAMNT_0000598573 /DNA_START=67 /DNA_END=1599 /DNA_ORIENTATION=- /assembly_acc=CAM_ASM_000170